MRESVIASTASGRAEGLRINLRLSRARAREQPSENGGRVGNDGRARGGFDDPFEGLTDKDKGWLSGWSSDNKGSEM
jgi:hypothetical protein